MRPFFAAWLFGLVAWAGSAAADGVSANELAVAEHVTLAGTLREDAAQLLKAEGALVVDLRLPEEGTDAERDVMTRTGVGYVHLATGGSIPDRDHVARLDAILRDNAERPIVIHCRSGNRAGLMWAAWLLEQGVPLDEASRAVDGIVTSDRIRGAIQGYSNRLNAED